MRITFLSPTLNMSGGVRVVSIYARLLARRGHQVCVASTAPTNPAESRHPEEPSAGNIAAPSGKHHPLFEPNDAVQHLFLQPGRMPRDEDLPDADVIVATWWETAEWLMSLSPRKGSKVYFIQHHEVFEYLPIERVRATYRLPLHQIVVAKWLDDVLRNEYGKGGASIVPNAVDHNLFNAPPRSKCARPSIGFIYSLTPFKGSDVALQTLSRIKMADRTVEIKGFGLDPLPFWRKLRLGIHFQRNPDQEALAGLYAGVDVWLSTSWTEGFNLPALEAMSCRTPVVSTRTGWPAEAIRDGQNGRLAEPGDVPGLAKACLDLLHLSDSDWRRMSEGAHDTAGQYQWSDSVTLFEMALEKARNAPTK